MGRMRRGAAADRLAARMTEDIVIDDDEALVIDEPGDDEPDETVVIEDEPEEPAPTIDTSHEDDEEEDEPEEIDGLADLKKQLDAMSQRNQQLEAAVADGTVAEIEGQLRELDTAIAVSKRNLQSARDDFAAKLAAGDHKGAADAQLKITETHADVREFEGAAAEIKTQLSAAKKPAPRVASDPFEASIAGVTEKSKEWCRANKADLQKSPARGHKAMAAHMEALDAGIKADTPEYFDFLNEQMGYKPAVTKTTKTAKPVGKARVAAPGGSRSAPARGGDVTEVRLSQKEIEFARTLFPNDKNPSKRYADQKKELIKNGRDPSRSGPRYSQQTEANRR